MYQQWQRPTFFKFDFPILGNVYLRNALVSMENKNEKEIFSKSEKLNGSTGLDVMVGNKKGSTSPWIKFLLVLVNSWFLECIHIYHNLQWLTDLMKVRFIHCQLNLSSSIFKWSIKLPADGASYVYRSGVDTSRGDIFYCDTAVFFQTLNVRVVLYFLFYFLDSSNEIELL